MAYDVTPYERVYGRLVSLYPRSFRERLGESMRQTFGDLCRERRDAGKSLMLFAVSTYADTCIGIIKEEIRIMKLQTKVTLLARTAIVITLGILAVTWWANGRNDTWLYVTSGIIAASSFFYIKPIGKDGDS